MNLNLIIVIVFIIFVAFVIKNKSDKGKTEGFYASHPMDCGYKSRRGCYRSPYCGWCWSANGSQECVAGGASGPLFRKDCIYYEYDHPSVYPYYRSGYYYYPQYYRHRYPKGWSGRRWRGKRWRRRIK